MNIKAIFLSLLLSVPAFAGQPSPNGELQLSDFDGCVTFAINYSLLVFAAHNSKDQKEYNEFVEQQISNQRSPDVKIAASIRSIALEAWMERNISPTIAGTDIYRQCVQSINGPTSNSVEKGTSL